MSVPASLPLFLLCRRGKGRKWFAVLGVNYPGPLAWVGQAARFHRVETRDLEAHYSSVAKQANFGGFDPEFRTVTTSGEQANLQWLRERWVFCVAMWNGADMARFRDSFSMAADYSDAQIEGRDFSMDHSQAMEGRAS